MQSINGFALNLNTQKAIAKKRLKAIRSGELTVLAKVHKYHSRTTQVNAGNIQLADVQHALARELGLPSWSKLKHHIQKLEQHRLAISNHMPPLDKDTITLHVRCGHDIQEKLKESGFEGDFLALIDPLSIGPLPAFKKDFIIERAQYIKQTLLPIMNRSDEDVNKIVSSEPENLAKLVSDKYQRIVFWVEHDSYDQFMLINALNQLELTQLELSQNKVIEIIEVNQFPGTDRFIGFGQLPSEAIRSCWQNRKVVTPKLMVQATRCWQALTLPNPSLLVSLLASDEIDCLPNMHNALKRHIQELPNDRNGLSLTQTIALQVLKNENEPITLGSWFARYQQKEPLPFLGDVMFYGLLLPITKEHNHLIYKWNKLNSMVRT
jgi:hypothetical protein